MDLTGDRVAVIDLTTSDDAPRHTRQPQLGNARRAPRFSRQIISIDEDDENVQSVNATDDSEGDDDYEEDTAHNVVIRSSHRRSQLGPPPTSHPSRNQPTHIVPAHSGRQPFSSRRLPEPVQHPQAQDSSSLHNTNPSLHPPTPHLILDLETYQPSTRPRIRGRGHRTATTANASDIHTAAAAAATASTASTASGPSNEPSGSPEVQFVSERRAPRAHSHVHRAGLRGVPPPFNMQVGSAAPANSNSFINSTGNVMFSTFSGLLMQARQFVAPVMDYAGAGFDLRGGVLHEDSDGPDWVGNGDDMEVDGDGEGVLAMWSAPTVKSLPPPPEGWTRSPKDKEVLVCPNCDDELGVGDEEVRRQIWAVKGCGHVSFFAVPHLCSLFCCYYGTW